ncbi:ATP-binding protein [Pedobacter panaciterrae]|uniref:ATP-binding protein n=1 Tax=Pedobacter panaciterrae TaxID=363849 RepID=A0ABU8NV83_9SPHI
MKNKEAKYDIIRPKAEYQFQSARSYGYSIETSIADLIDNSISAKASKIHISFGIDRYASFVRIEDNGDGMNEQQLKDAMRLGSLDPLEERLDDDLGRFGLGLKTASFSQCRRLTVKTKKTKLKEFVRCWDLDFIAKKKDWALLRDCIDDHSRKNLGELTFGSKGTVILWEKMDRLMESDEHNLDKENFYRKFENVKKHLGLIFHRYIEKNDLEIVIFNDIVAPVNPFDISSEYPSTELQEEQLSIKGRNIVIQPYILPHESKMSKDEKDQVQMTKGWTEHQGIYLYRNHRLISDGGWLDLNFRLKENQRLCRISIDLPNTLDKEWQIDIKKASAKIPDLIRKRIKEICFSAIEKAVKVYTHRGAYIRRPGEKRETTFLWVAKQKQGLKTYTINEKHPLYELLINYLGTQSLVLKDYAKLLAETIPVNLIVNDFADPTVIIGTPLQHKVSELEEIYETALRVLIESGVPEKNAIAQLNAMDVFQRLK